MRSLGAPPAGRPAAGHPPHNTNGGGMKRSDVIASASEAIHGPAHRRPFVVIPGWSEGPDLRCAIAHRGISRFRVRAGARPGMTCLVKDTPPRSRGAPEFCSTYFAI